MIFKKNILRRQHIKLTWIYSDQLKSTNQVSDLSHKTLITTQKINKRKNSKPNFQSIQYCRMKQKKKIKKEHKKSPDSTNQTHDLSYGRRTFAASGRICVHSHMISKNREDKDFLSFISVKREQESPPSILVTKNPHQSQRSGSGTGCVKGRYQHPKYVLLKVSYIF